MQGIGPPGLKTGFQTRSEALHCRHHTPQFTAQLTWELRVVAFRSCTERDFAFILGVHVHPD